MLSAASTSWANEDNAWLDIKDRPIYCLGQVKIVQGQVKCLEDLSSDKHEKHKYCQ